jgi:hypothetical protein
MFHFYENPSLVKAQLRSLIRSYEAAILTLNDGRGGLGTTQPEEATSVLQAGLHVLERDDIDIVKLHTVSGNIAQLMAFGGAAIPVHGGVISEGLNDVLSKLLGLLGEPSVNGEGISHWHFGLAGACFIAIKPNPNTLLVVTDHEQGHSLLRWWLGSTN